MRGAKRGPRGKGAVEVSPTRRGVDAGHLQGLFRVEQRQQALHAVSEHGLARSRRPQQEEVMASCGRHLQRPPSEGLASDVGQVVERARPAAVLDSPRPRFGPGRPPL